MRLGHCTDGCRHDEKREGFDSSDREHRKEKSGIIFCMKMPLFDPSPFLYLVCRDVYFSTLLQFIRPSDHTARAYSHPSEQRKFSPFRRRWILSASGY